MPQLKLGTFLPQNWKYDPQGDLVNGARAAEEIGYDSVWVFERVLYAEDQSGVHRLTEYGNGSWPDVYRRVIDPVVALSMAAAVTSRVRVGTAVLVPPLHVPFRLAYSFASIAAASGGRVVAGLGTGWSVDEYAATAPRPMAERGAALDEFLDMAEAVWGADPVSFKNERYTVYPAEVGPKPPARIPVLLGARSQRALDRVSRRASGWLAPPSMTPAQVAATFSGLRENAAGYGRNPAGLSCTAVVSFRGPFSEVPERGRMPYTGSIDQVISDLADLADAGVEEVALTLPLRVGDISQFRDLAAEFHGSFRAAGI
jgi:probable F420-dependent oxidoreductase